MPFEDRLKLSEACEWVELTLAEVICDRGDEETHAYFPTSSVIYSVSMADGRAGVELGMTGAEGMMGAHLVLGSFPSPLRTLVQSPGWALRIKMSDFLRQLTDSDALRDRVSRYLYVQHCQQATSAACLRFHQIDQRLARWLLMTQDRIADAAVPMTQEFLAYLLGVRRMGTSIATSTLLRDGIISYTGGTVRVLNRDGLMAATCSCYGIDRRTHESSMGSRVEGT